MLVVILLVVGINSCLDSRKDRAFRDYAADVRALVDESNDSRDQLFELLSKPEQRRRARRPEPGQRPARGRRAARRAGKSTDHPDELNGANGWLVDALQFRRDAIEQIAAAAPDGARRQGQPSRRSTRSPGQMQALLASDVIYLAAHVPELQRHFDKRSIDERFPTDRFLPDLGWLDPDTVETRLGKLGGTAARRPRPGLHGTGLQGVTAKPSGTVLTESGVNRVAVGDQLAFDVEVQNQGESEETDVAVSVTITDGKQINVDQTIPRIAAGADRRRSASRSPRSPTPAPSASDGRGRARSRARGTRTTTRRRYQVVFTESAEARSSAGRREPAADILPPCPMTSPRLPASSRWRPAASRAGRCCWCSSCALQAAAAARRADARCSARAASATWSRTPRASQIGFEELRELVEQTVRAARAAARRRRAAARPRRSAARRWSATTPTAR